MEAINSYARIPLQSSITITEDQALQLNKPLETLIKEAESNGYKEYSTYHHPAVGKVIKMRLKTAL